VQYNVIDLFNKISMHILFTSLHIIIFYGACFENLFKNQDIIFIFGEVFT